jgi:hypothetical protein
VAGAEADFESMKHAFVVVRIYLAVMERVEALQFTEERG